MYYLVRDNEAFELGDEDWPSLRFEKYNLLQRLIAFFISQDVHPSSPFVLWLHDELLLFMRGDNSNIKIVDELTEEQKIVKTRYIFGSQRCIEYVIGRYT